MRHGSVCRQLTLERDDDTGHSQRFSTDFWLWREPRTCSRALLPFLVAEPLLCFQPHAWAFLANLLTVDYLLANGDVVVASATFVHRQHPCASEILTESGT